MCGFIILYIRTGRLPKMITTHKTANLYLGNCMRKRYSRITSTKSSSFCM